MSGRFLSILFTFMLLIKHGILLAQAAPVGGPVALQSAEPNRFALVIGNANYGDGLLPPLGSACRQDPADTSGVTANDPPGDAEVVASAFKAAGWRDVTKLCNLSSLALGAAIQAFVDKVGATERAMGVIYFSGHGAEIGEHNYLFGTDAAFDPKIVARTYNNNRRAVLFGGSAVDLEYVLGRYPGMSAKGIVVIVDACRDNPVLKELQTAGAPILYPTRSRELTGVLLSFATSGGRRAPAGELDKPTMFAAVLADAIRTAALPPSVQIGELIEAVNDRIARSTRGAQTPRLVGRLHRPPVFCLAGCASEVSAWESQDLSFEDDPEISMANSPLFRVASGMIGLRLAASRPVVRSPQGSSESLLHLATFQDNSLSDAALQPAEKPNPSTATLEELATLRPFAFDIYWCSGDPGAQERHERAVLYQSILNTRLTGAAIPVAGYALGNVRVIGLPNELADKFKITGLLLRIDAGSNVERAWGNSAAALFKERPTIRETKASSPDRISIYVCENRQNEDVVDDVYFQVPREEQKAPISSVKSAVAAKMEGIHMIKGTQATGDRSPSETQVRYFYLDQKAKADELADKVGDEIGHAVEARYLSGYEKDLNGKRVMEVWVGAADESPAVQASNPM